MSVSDKEESENNLPDLLIFKGDWDKYVNDIYSIFKQIFIIEKLYIDEKKVVKIRKHPAFNEKESAFWHLVSEGSDEDSREPNIRRCERIRWVHHLIVNKGEPFIKEWITVRKTGKGKARRTCLALENFSYMVVLEERDQYWLFITAYPLEKRHQRKKKEMEYEKHQKTGDAF